MIGLLNLYISKMKSAIELISSEMRFITGGIIAGEKLKGVCLNEVAPTGGLATDAAIEAYAENYGEHLANGH